MMDGRCETCHYWGQETRAVPGFRRCNRVGDTPGHSGQTALAWAWHHEGYHAGLDTRADFGCVEWTERGEYPVDDEA